MKKSPEVPAKIWPQVRIHPEHERSVKKICDQFLISRTDAISLVLSMGITTFLEGGKGFQPAPGLSAPQIQPPSPQPTPRKDRREGGKEAV